ncbi:hypothetical protein [Thermomonospora umbrina]|uniref:Uncharacterized protein n=1 Tax=Thermomonospora umbrina TaxID=111806 RepID=A0A3D9SXE9_9ACTN|nr:hypothetical protein [Thermomonospora umbrina]REF00238.1 hypothetical protein DFJ69_5766 [Thermomonospora umbrina]
MIRMYDKPPCRAERSGVSTDLTVSEEHALVAWLRKNAPVAFAVAMDHIVAVRRADDLAFAGAVAASHGTPGPEQTVSEQQGDDR